jgi:primary-amine oxidase
MRALGTAGIRLEAHVIRALLLLILFVSVPGAAAAQPIQHPLDPLTWQEHWTVLEVLRDAKHLDADTRFSMVNLVEPAKDTVWSWKAGQAIPRTAFALVRQGSEAFEAIIDLSARRLTRWQALADAHPNWLLEELFSASEFVKKAPEFVAAMRKRGIEDLTFIDCASVPPGYFGTEEQRGRRVAHVMCNDARGVRNGWTRQIGGLTVVVDMHAKKVLRVVDEGAIPMTTASGDYDAAAIGKAREVPGPLRVEQPLGPGFRLDGHVVEWQRWRFHVRPDHRTGMIVSTVTYDDGGTKRPVLYQGHLSEIFVPYMDPSFAWYARNFLDAGEFTFEGLSKPLIQGRDCPANAVYVDALFAGDNGRPSAVARVLCLFERATGDMSWRHWDGAGEGASESRASRDLVVRTAAVLGNYDYVFDWIFQQNGALKVAVGATGIAENKIVAAQTAAESTTSGNGGSNGASNGGGGAGGGERADAYGRFVDRQIVAVNHDHYFNFRLDLDVDGPSNSLLVDRLVPKTLPANHPRRSLWVREPAIAQREADGQLDMDMHRPALWRVVSASRTNHVGYPTSYQLMSGMNGMTLLSEDDPPRQRAGFINHHLWVTPYRAGERYAAGDYPTLSTPGQGLPAWTKANRAIEQTDIVLWHTIGMHHVVRAEDWPVMPVLWHSFELRPFDFFNRNPALDLPR